VKYLIKKTEIKSGKLVLAGDFFHTKASLLSSNLAGYSIPYYLSVIEEESAKVKFWFI
jgi:hypothetical protein